MAQVFLWLLDGINQALRWIVGILFALATLAVLVQVVVRFVLPPLGFTISAPWTEESARYLVTWGVFLGIAVLCRDARLIAVEVFAHALPESLGRLVKILGVLLSIVFFACLVRSGIEWTAMSSIEASPVMRIPMDWIYVSMPVGSALAILNLVGFLVGSRVGKRDPALRAAEVTGD